MINKDVIDLVNSLEVLCTSDLSPLSIAVLETLEKSLQFGELDERQKANVTRVLDEYSLYLSQIYPHISYRNEDIIDYIEVETE